MNPTTDAAALQHPLAGRAAALGAALYDGARPTGLSSPGLPAEAREHAAYLLGTLLATLIDSAAGGHDEATALLERLREGFDDERAPLAGDLQIGLNAGPEPV